MSNDRKNGPATSYYDGTIVERGLINFVGKLDLFEDDDYSHGRLYSWNEKQARWGAKDLPWSVSSVCIYRPKNGLPAIRASCSLGTMSGQIELFWKGGTKTDIEMLPGADKHGPERIGLLHLHQIIQIEDDLYVAGSDSQVFRRHEGKWGVFNHGLESNASQVFLRKDLPLDEAVNLLRNTRIDLTSIDC